MSGALFMGMTGDFNRSTRIDSFRGPRVKIPTLPCSWKNRQRQSTGEAAGPRGVAQERSVALAAVADSIGVLTSSISEEISSDRNIDLSQL